MTSKELNLKLIKLLPEIEALYNEEVSWQEGNETGSHVVFGDVLYPYIEDCANSENYKALSSCFNAIETILSINDEYAIEVITLSILENLLYMSESKIILTKYMGHKTKKIFEELVNEEN